MSTSAYKYTIGSTGNQKTFTLSGWFKICGILDTAADGAFFSYYSTATNNPRSEIVVNNDLKIYVGINPSGLTWKTLIFPNRLRDPAAWYHMVFAYDTTQSVEADRVKVYVNGNQITPESGDYPSLNEDTGYFVSGDLMNIGKDGAAVYWSGNMAHVNITEGTAYAPTAFGEFDSTSGIWIPKSGPSVTYGDEGGFYKFAADALTTDSSGSGNTLTAIGTPTATKDSPDNNFATWNPLYVPDSNLPTFANGNTTTVHATTSGGWHTMQSTIGLSKGKWYWETIGGNSSGHIYNGVCSPEWLQWGDPTEGTGPEGEMGKNLSQPSYGVYALNGTLTYSNTSGNNNQETSYTSAYDNTDYTSVYLDLDNHKIYWSINGVIQNSGTGWDLQTGFTYIPCVSLYDSAAAGVNANFGNGVFASTALGGTTYSDDDGIGIFKYSPNYGGAATFDSSAKNFMSLCTSNLATYG